ncbi:hypothetical protein RRG08_049061 [Elysia crispata]|uniref:Uncharacterized protein n=1 Tax=Elysia crispata TaxID=231223 RepID=A0AAE1ABF8_9GAST|nr:hypothetical protein RRG08_049061 [Elysia crispata]
MYSLFSVRTSWSSLPLSFSSSACSAHNDRRLSGESSDIIHKPWSPSTKPLSTRVSHIRRLAAESQIWVNSYSITQQYWCGCCLSPVPRTPVDSPVFTRSFWEVVGGVARGGHRA